MKNNIKTIYFDFDGTLHDSIKIYAPAFRKGFEYLVKENQALARTWSEDEIAYWLGYNKEEMWNNFMPDLDEKFKIKAGQIIGYEMIKCIEEGRGKLYEGAIEVLEYLVNKNYSLVFLSNCGISYKEKVDEVFQLYRYFSKMVCSEEYDYLPKGDILTRIIKQNTDEIAVIGDRYHDIEAGIQNKTLTIGCAYGYGSEAELSRADYLIKDIRDVMNLFSE